MIQKVPRILRMCRKKPNFATIVSGLI